MPAAFALVWGVVLGWASGGSLRRLETMDIRFPYVLLVVFVAQGLIRGRVGEHGSEVWGLLVWAVLSVILVALLAVQVTNAMLTVVALGVSANVLVVLLNGSMPVFPPGASASLSESGFYALGNSSTIAPVLADCLPLHLAGAIYLFSLGDLLLVAGAAGFVASGMLASD